MTMFSFNRVDARPNASTRNPSTAASDRQPFAVRLASACYYAASPADAIYARSEERRVG